MDPFLKISSLVQLYELLPEQERIITDILRHLIRRNLPETCKEKISYNVPFFYGNKGICIIWPATVPRGGVKTGVLLGFWYGAMLKDPDHYLIRGTNKRVLYHIFHQPEEIMEKPIVGLLKEAIKIDNAR